MRISNWSINLRFNTSNFIYNTLTNEIFKLSVDELACFKYLQDHKNVSIQTGSAKFNCFEKMVEKSIFTDLEKDEEVSLALEFLENKIKNDILKEKTLSIVVDTSVINNWCLSKTQKKDMFDFNHLDYINCEKEDIWLWLDLNKRTDNNIKDLIQKLKRKNKTITLLFTNSDEKDLVNLLKKLSGFYIPTYCFVSDKNKEGIYFYNPNNNQLSKAYEEDPNILKCPFLYKTYFADSNGNTFSCYKDCKKTFKRSITPLCDNTESYKCEFMPLCNSTCSNEVNKIANYKSCKTKGNFLKKIELVIKEKFYE